MIKIYYLLFLFSWLFASCSTYPSDIDKALKISEENRAELEAVLKYFARCGDMQKLESAYFLIANMAGHYSYAGPYVESYQRFIQSQYGDFPDYYDLFFNSYPFLLSNVRNGLTKKQDLKYLKSGDLIRHIEAKYKLWKTAPWGKDISFEVFCKYLLPYRFDTELLSSDHNNQIENYIAKLSLEKEKMQDFQHLSIYQYGEYIMDKIVPPEKWISKFSFPAPIGLYTADCYLSTLITHFRLQAVGIPSAIDFVPQWADYNSRHYWNVFFDPEIGHSRVNESSAHKAAKVYRKTYTPNPHPTADRNFIPFLFQSPFNMDVTDEYVQCADIELPLITSKKARPKYAYLAVFSDTGWSPIAWAEVSNGKAKFSKVGINNVYQVVYYNENDQITAGHPFILTIDKNIRVLKPDLEQNVSMRLYRKFPMTSAKMQWAETAVGCRIEAANTPNFRDAKTILTIDSANYGAAYTIINNSSDKFRYWRLKGSLVLAEFSLLDSLKNRMQGIPLSSLANYHSKNHIVEVLHKSPSDACKVNISGGDRVASVFDGSPLTYYLISDWVGYDMLKPIIAPYIELVVRNDENYIYKGDMYKLLYCDTGEWVSLGIQEAQSSFLLYNNSPKGALYWLRNLTKGREERIFTFENGHVVFW